MSHPVRHKISHSTKPHQGGIADFGSAHNSRHGWQKAEDAQKDVTGLKYSTSSPRSRPLHEVGYYLTATLDGHSRYIVHWEIRTSMTRQDEMVILQRALEKFPGERPRIISDNGAQFVAKDFKEFIRFSGLTHARTSPYYPQSNGKLERFNKTIKTECIRPSTPLSLEDALRIVRPVRGTLQPGPLAQRDRLLGASRQVGRA